VRHRARAAYAVEVREGCTDIEVSRSRMTDLGAGGVKIWYHSARTTVADNEIAHTGMIALTSYGVLVGTVRETRSSTTTSTIASTRASSSAGRCSSSQATPPATSWSTTTSTTLAWGDERHGGIYTEGICAGTRIRYNVVHDVRARLGDNNGIYHDSGADILVEKNLVYNCTPLHVHYTRNITIENNILALGGWAQVTRAGVFGVPMPEYSFRRNIVYLRQGRVVGSWDPSNRNCAYDRNLYWDASGQPLSFGDKGLEEWQAASHDAHSVIADPLFVDPEHGDFRLRPGSPAAQIGFEPWDLSEVGPRP